MCVVVWCPNVSCSGFEISVCLAFFNIEFFNFPKSVSHAEQTIQDVKLM